MWSEYYWARKRSARFLFFFYNLHHDVITFMWNGPHVVSGYFRANSKLAPSQWKMSWQSNAVSHWLGANLESALYLEKIPTAGGPKVLDGPPVQKFECNWIITSGCDSWPTSQHHVSYLHVFHIAYLHTQAGTIWPAFADNIFNIIFCMNSDAIRF